ncbi:MAG: TIGR00289 family protein [Candidatus Aenigmarchaeota archaeon]|nr:TIGR00289 family protein [Candidatus Aenigmarchaeota archaeon]
MKLAALVSGGKDSLYAAHVMQQQGHKITQIVSMISENPESYMFHVPNARLVEKQAETMHIPLVQRKTKGEKEKELNDLKSALEGLDIDGVVTGAVASNYQKTRIDNICKELSLASIAPLWHADQELLLRKMVDDGFEIIITAVAADGLTENWLGRNLNDCMEELIKLSKKHRFSPIGEGGEFETLVVNCPLFKKRLKITESKKHWDGMSGWMEIKI